MIDPIFDAPPDAAVLVAVINAPRDLARARDEGWYRIPLAHVPPRVAADFIAFYQTGAFPLEERWSVRWCAPVRGYYLAARRELIPEEADHPRADDRYYRVALDTLQPLPRPIPSRRLRRITFIRTTLGRLLAAQEINDLWLRTPAQERLWQALQQAGLEAEVETEYPLADDLPYTADFAVFCGSAHIAVIVTDGNQDDSSMREARSLDYLLAREGWHAVTVDARAGEAVASCLERIRRIQLASLEPWQKDL